MNQIDIHKIPKKQVYKTPPDLFIPIQKNVLENTIGEKQNKNKTKNISIPWRIIAAASVILLFGGLFFWNNFKVKPLPINQRFDSQDIMSRNQNASKQENKKQNDVIILQPSEQKETLEIKEQKLVKNEVENKVKTKKKELEIKKTSPEEQIDFILANLTEEEIINLTQSTDQDIYLELYN